MNTILLTLLLAGAQAAAAQEPPRAAQESTAEEYVVGPQDVIALIVFNDESLSRPALSVDSEGTVDCPLIGRVKVSGLTTRQIEEDLRRRLGLKRDAQGRVVGGYLNSPNISVVVKEFRSQRVYVTGAVKSPGFVELQGDPTLTRALAEAGYPTSESGSYVLITHAIGGQPPTGSPAAARPEDQLRVAREEIDTGRASRIRLRAGDFVFVPTADKFFVTGEVKSMGQYVLNGELNVLQALAMAGGVTDRANKGKIKIERIVNGEKVEIAAKESTIVQAGDTIKVPKRFW